VAGIVAFYQAAGCIGVAEMLGMQFGAFELGNLAPFLCGPPAAPKRRYATLGAALVGDKHSCKTLRISKWHDIARWLRMEGYDVFQLGAEGELVIDDAAPLTHLPMQRQLWILAHSAVHVGADGFLNHAAAVFGVPAVTLWGVTPREVWGHAGQAAVVSPQSENFWLSRAGWWEKDYDKCRGIMNAIMVENVIETIKKTLKHEEGNRQQA
jgi:ADP-heptose:LPS heptosyltransferase